MKVIKCDVCGEMIPNCQYVFRYGYKWVTNIGIKKYDVCRKCGNEVFDKMGTVAITETYFGDEWADDICDVPTILEAEEER